MKASDIWNDSSFKAAVESMRAGRLEILLARIFGNKTVTESEGYRLVIHDWRGKSYLTDFERFNE